ncbi:MAG: hypothetical protein ACRCZF_17105, partial [Gemmataceae bacterium]
MRLLASVWPQLRRLLPSPERWLSFGVVAFIAAVELIGRHAPSDLYDLAAGLAVISMVTFVVSWHRRYPLGWLTWADRAIERLSRAANQLKYQIGIDFRGTPPFPYRAPRIVAATAVVLLAWSALAFVVWQKYPNGWRDLGLQSSYVLYLVLLMFVWGMLFACALAGIYLPVWVVDQRLKAAQGHKENTSVDSVALVGYGVLATLVAWVTPAIYAVLLCGSVLLAGTAWYFGIRQSDAAVLWRARSSPAIFAIPMMRVIAGAIALGSLALFALLVTAAGGHLQSAPTLGDPMLFTALLGSLVAWLVPGVVAVIGYHLVQLRRKDPSARMPITLTVQGDWPQTALRALRRHGFQLLFGARRPEHAGVRLVLPEQSQAEEFEPAWPLAIAPDDVARPMLVDRLRRRDEIVCRRLFFRGFKKLFKQVKLTTPRSGGGYWIAPHWWFIESVQWEEPPGKSSSDADQLRPLGPTFEEAFGP